jgi:signal transduction histidine kinase/ActR/RegA family two-component response regulator
VDRPLEASSWREGTLRGLLLTLALAGLGAYVPAVVLALEAGQVMVAAVDTLLYAGVLLACFLPRLAFRMRALGLLAVVYLLGAFLLVKGGPLGSGTLWLFCLPVFAGVLLGTRAAVVSVCLNLATLTALFWLHSAELLGGSWAGFPAGALPLISAHFLLLDSAAAVSVSVLVSRVEKALAEEQASQATLVEERRELVALNSLVSREMQELVAAGVARAALEDQLRQAQKMEAIGRLAGGVAHDFNNLLTAILGHTALALRGVDEPDRLHRRLDEIQRAAQRAAALTQRLLAFSRKQVLQPRVISLNEAVRDMESMLRRLIGEDIEMVVRLEAGPLTVHADPVQLQQVLMNLVVNARDAMPRGGRLTLETGTIDSDAPRPADAPEGALVVLEVSDTGIGIDAETMKRIFEPFFTTKPPGEGTGLGLATVYGIITQSGGHVAVDSEAGKGATFRILLPEAPQPAEPLLRPLAEVPPPSGRETILLVEDEDLLRNMTTEVLQDLGYRVLDASSGRSALLVSAQPERIDLVLTDVVMPGMGGREVWEAVSRQHPESRVLYMSGYTDDAIVRHGVTAAEVTLLNKPFTPQELGQRVREVLDAPEGQKAGSGQPLREG